MAKIEITPKGEFHSGYGCVIMAAAAGVFLFIAWWMFYHVPVTMDRELAAIAQEAPAKLPDITPVPDLQERLSAFATAASAGQKATLKLSVADLNALLLMAPDTGGPGYKDMLRIKSLDAAKGLITTDASLPMNTAKFWEGKKRYLVGEIDFSLEKTALGPDTKVSAVRVPGKKLPDEMLKGMQMYGYCGPFHNDTALGPIFKAITEVKVEADGLLVTSGQ